MQSRIPTSRKRRFLNDDESFLGESSIVLIIVSTQVRKNLAINKPIPVIQAIPTPTYPIRKAMNWDVLSVGSNVAMKPKTQMAATATRNTETTMATSSFMNRPPLTCGFSDLVASILHPFPTLLFRQAGLLRDHLLSRLEPSSSDMATVDCIVNSIPKLSPVN